MPERTERTSGTEYEVPAGGPTLVLLEATINAEVDTLLLEVGTAQYPPSQYPGGLAALCCRRFEGVMAPAIATSFTLPASGNWIPLVQITGRPGAEVRLYSRYL
jgi:hypothetical protein